MKQENYTRKGKDGELWYRITGLAKKLDVTDQSIRNWIDSGIVLLSRDDKGHPWVRLANGVVKGGGCHGLCKYGFEEGNL